MTKSVLDILSFAIYPAVAVLIGGGISLFRSAGPGMRSAIQHFSAGVIFAALATELLPDVMHRRMPVVTVAGFALGVIVMLGMKHLTERFGQKGIAQANQPTSLIFALAVDITLDGMLIGLGFAAGQKQGLLITIALTLEVLFLGLSCGTALMGAGALRSKVMVTTAILMTCLLVGATGGALLLAGVSGIVLDAVLAFGVAALLYLVTEELLVEAHEAPEKPIQTAMFFVGFIVLLVIEMLL